MKLELKHLAPYLPYGLKIYCTDVIEEMRTLNSCSLNIKGRSNIYGMFADIDEVKPILRPMSDLENHPHIFSYGIFPSCVEDIIRNKSEFDLYNTPYDIYIILIENHFDVFGLIPAGLAIDINTV